MRKKYSGVRYQGLTNRRRFGVELEINNTVPRKLIRDVINDYSDRRIRLAGWEQSVDNDYWHVKQDSTCGLIGKGYDKGWEVASFVGHGEDDIAHIGLVAQALAEAGCEVNENCGLHVHVEAADFDSYQMGILLGHYAKFEGMLTECVPEHRLENPYCETFFHSFHHSERNQYWSPPEMWFRMKPLDLSPHSNPYRWRSINLVNFCLGMNIKNWRRRTVEFRLPECSLVDYDVKNWIRLFVNFVEWTKHQKMPENIESVGLKTALKHMGLGHDDDTFYILGRELFHTKTWLLRRFIRMNKEKCYGKWVTQEPKEILREMWWPVRNFT